MNGFNWKYMEATAAAIYLFFSLEVIENEMINIVRSFNCTS